MKSFSLKCLEERTTCPSEVSSELEFILDSEMPQNISFAFTFKPNDEIDESEEDYEFNRNEEPIFGYYCTCWSGARTVGTYAHVASVLWFLGYARHEPNIRYPSTSIVNIIRDARNRPR
ncbi:unnamed protein product [Psylliodes chrysocephalus]|uniref:Uncharacterized protein n=1 Tax=Psylliodes chrysocephalus TaxID=3402493 RepID=A0A9P0GEI0_9CUCU|nr:unnamed protein product [Psylliodes chrysocephala]